MITHFGSSNSSLNVPDMTLVEVEVGEVYRHIYDLNIHKAMGWITFLLSLLKLHQMVWPYFLLSLLIKALHFIYSLIFGRMLL